MARSVRSRVAVMMAAGLMGLSGVVAVAAQAQSHAPSAKRFGVEVLSTRADAVTGGDVLVEVRVPRNVPMRKVSVTVEGRDVTDAFREGQSPRTLVGLIEGLGPGEHTIEVAAKGSRHGRPHASVVVTNHPITGPVFSGPHQSPFVCQTEAFGLGPAVDEYCSAPTKVEYVYRTTDGSFEPFDPDGPAPGDLTQTTTSEGATVDYVVRLETGVINRAVYQLAFLHEPGTPLPDPWTSTSGWNGRLVYTFGGNCDAGYRQGRSTGGVLNDAALSSGFAVASSSLNVFGNDCNDVISAETAMMVKEYFIESYGPDRWTIGWGASGGSMQQHLIAQNYPGILDGILPALSYSDITTIITPVTDCGLILKAVEGGTHSWTLEQLSAVTGFANDGDHETCTSWNRGVTGFSPGWISPEEPVAGAGCQTALGPELLYDPESNPDGARCTVYDTTVNVFGRDPETGFARRPLDNVGVQYGLEAFNDGVIEFDQFAELNRLLGGYDVDGNQVPHRTVADPLALQKAYTTGRVNAGAGGLSQVPIIDVRRYTDMTPFTTAPDIHDRVRSLATRERLIAANGHAGNHVIFTVGPTGTRAGSYAVVSEAALHLMDQWLAAVDADTAPGTIAEKVVRNKPGDAVDSCWTPSGERIMEPTTFDGPGICNDLYSSHEDPRMAAGGPLAGDVLKCAVKPVRQGDYSQKLTAEQLDELRAIFPAGVCDWTRPSVGQLPLAGTWLHY